MSDPHVEENRGATRWVVLVLMSLVVFANYYLYDCFSTLKGTLQTELGASSTQWGLIRNFYNVPNTFLFMALLGGIFLDRFGIRKTGVIFTSLCALGGLRARGAAKRLRPSDASTPGRAEYLHAPPPRRCPARRRAGARTRRQTARPAV